MSKEDNLKKIQTTERAKKMGRKGGIASAKARREKKLLRECLEMLLDREFTDTDGRVVSGAEAISTKVFQQALLGDLKAFEIVRDTVGQKPVEKVQINEVEQAVIDDIEARVKAHDPEPSN